MKHVCIWALAVAVLAAPARGGLGSLERHTREPFAAGQSFGDAGPYERLLGVARFAVDPAHPRNKAIVDLDKAPRNARGLVEFTADVFILKPIDPARGNG